MLALSKAFAAAEEFAYRVSADEVGALAFLAGAGMMLMLIAFVLYILSIIALWRIFTKAGEAGWKSLIPVYNLYIQYKIAWDTKYFWVTIALILVSGALKSAGGGALIGILSTVAGIALIIVTALENYYLSVSFGHGIAFTVGLTFVGPLFLLILGLGSSRYVGKGGIYANSVGN